MNKQFLRFTFFLLIYLTLPLTVTAQVINIPDPNLRAAIENALGKPAGAPITADDMATLTELEAQNANISNLTGLEHATNLTGLWLGDREVAGEGWINSNSIKDLSPLAGLTNLTWLNLSQNNITDLSPLAELTNLTWLDIGSNNLSNISPVSGLINLTALRLWRNNIEDISPVADLTHLTELNLNHNNISNISAVTGLTNLTELNLSINFITDISPLVANTGLGNGDTIHVRANRLSDQSLFTHIPVLQSRGVTVEFNSPAPFENVLFDVTNIPEPVPPPREVSDFFELDPFYQQWINIEGFPVLASANVSPYAVKEAAWKIRQMIGHRSDILKILARNRIRFSIVGHNELTTDIPELRDLSPRFYQNVRLRGGAGGGSYGTAWAAEEHILGRWGYVTIHEMAHEIHGIVNQQINRTFDNRLETVYNEAMNKGLWQGSGNAVNKDEYWANGVNVWFHTHHSSPVKTRDALKAYDPSLASLITEVLGDHGWRHTPLRMRTHLPHLQGFNPQSAPQMELPPGTLEAYEELRNPAINERNEWVNLPPYNPSLIPKLNESRTRGDHTGILFANTDLIGAGGANDTWDQTEILFVNTIDAEVLLYWVNPDGTETLHYRSPPNTWAIDLSPCRVGDLLLAKDVTGRNLAVFQAVKKTGRALVSPALHLITPGLSKVSGDNQTGVSGTILANPFVIEVRDENLSVLEGISVTFTVTAGDGTFSTTSTTTDENGVAQSTYTLGQNMGINTVSVSAAGIEQPVIFNAVVEPAIDIPDPNFRAAVETALGKAKGDPITPSEIATLTRLEAGNANISDLTGLEGATNLTELILDNNSISDISPVVGLTNLTELILWDNNISDISPVVGLTNLKGLGLGGNSVTDISPIENLTNLTFLHLPGNSIADISLVTGLTQLTWLNLGGTNITDISSLSGLTNLTELWLIYNFISDLSPLVTNTGLGNGDEVNVKGNPLSYQSLHTHIPALQNRGVTVEFDNRPHPALLKISGDNQKGASFAPLSQPFVVEAQDENGSALAGISVRFAVTAEGGMLSTTITRTDENGRAQSTLTLGPNLGTNTVEVSAAGIEVPVTFHAISDTESPPITADINNDGSVNILDLILIASDLGNAGTNLAADVNRDGVVSILDLVLAAGMFEEAAAAPAAHAQAPKTLTAVEVQGWLIDARSLEVRDPIMKRGFVVLEQLLVSLTPRETELLANYPNPFNPETWIPYRLAEDTFVTLTIYDGSSHVVRTLDVGHRIASAYESRSKTVHWDGRNNLGEQVASGVYFYTLIAGNFSATRKMLILK